MSKKLTGRWALLATVVFLASCGPREGARLELFVSSIDQKVVGQVQGILFYRLSDASGGPLADVRTAYFPETRKLVFEIMVGAPAQDSLRYLYETRGEYRVFATDEAGDQEDWITNKDLAAVDGGRSFRTGKVFVGLNPEATRRVGEVSGERIGTTIQSSLDGEVIYETTVTWPIGRFYEFDVDDIERAKMMAIVLRHGVLPADVRDWSQSDAEPVAMR